MGDSSAVGRGARVDSQSRVPQECAVLRSRSASGGSRTLSSADDDVLNRGYPGFLTEKENRALEALRAATTTEQLDQIKYEVETYDWVLCRYLRARKFNVIAAQLMVQQSVEKRQQEKPWEAVALGPDGCLDCPEFAFKKIYPHFFSGFDKWGRPVLYDQVGRMELAGLTALTDVEKMGKYHWYTMDHLLGQKFSEASAKRYPNQRLGLVSVLDLQGIGINSFAKEVSKYVRYVSEVDQLCYPELLGRLFIVNAPLIFATLWMGIKVWLDPKTQAKIEIMSSPSVWKPRLQEFIPVEEIPEEYGGSAPPLRAQSEEHVDSIQVKPKSTWAKTVVVSPGQIVRAELFTQAADLEFSVARVGKDGKQTIVFGPERTQATKTRNVIRKSFDVDSNGIKEFVISCRNTASMTQRHCVVIAYAYTPEPKEAEQPEDACENQVVRQDD